MSVYKRSTPTERVRQLVDHINRYHEEFCRTEDQEKKSECLRLLKGYGMEYLNQVPHAQKFRTQRVEGVLTQSVYNMTDFDPREASEAFEHLAKFGQNLLEQPWREEFRTICLASGYYVHNIQAYLRNSHEILIAMGYTNIDDSTLQLATIPNPSYLKEVTRDCFLASQECLILSHIWDFVRTSTKYDVLAAEVYQYRKEYVGDTATIGQKICYDLRQRAYEESMKLQQKMSRTPSVYSQKNSCFDNCPVDNLVDVDSAMNGIKMGDMPEREIVQKVLRNTQKQQQLQENIYDPVAYDPVTLGFQPVNNSKQHLTPDSPSINSSSSYFIDTHNQQDTSASALGYGNHNHVAQYNNPPDFGLPDVSGAGAYRYNSQTRSSTASPYIPQSVSAFSNVVNNRENEFHNSRKPCNSIGSSSSGSGGGGYQQQQHLSSALQQRKVSEDEYLRENNSVRGTSRNNVLDFPNWLEVEKSKQKYSSPSTTIPSHTNSNNNRTIVNVNSDVKDGLSTSLNADNCLQEAYKYKSGVSSLVSDGGRKAAVDSSSYNNRHHTFSQQKDNILSANTNRSNSNKSSDNSNRVSSERESENNKSSASSSASSWGYTQSYTTEPVNKSLTIAAANEHARKKSLEKSHFPTSSSAFNPSGSNDEMYESEYKRQYNKGQPTEPLNFEDVYYQKLLAEGEGKEHNKKKSSSSSSNAQNDFNTRERDQHHYSQNQVLSPSNTNNYNNAASRSSTSTHHQENQSSYSQSNFRRGQHQETDLDAVIPSEVEVVDGKVLISSIDDDSSWIKIDTSSNRSSPSNTARRGEKQQQRQNQDEEQADNVVESVVTSWTCPHCTFHNYTSENICEMCARSKDFKFEPAEVAAVVPTPTSSIPKLYSIGDSKGSSSSSNIAKGQSNGTSKGFNQSKNAKGSKEQSSTHNDMIECPFCTVLNPRSRVLCEVCENRLKNLD